MHFLLEINTEEMPKSHIETALRQLKDNLTEELRLRDIRVSQMRTYGTCRRLIVVSDFSPRQKDKEELLIGPPKSVSLAEDGSFTPAAKGFAKSQKIKLSELKFIKTERGEYVGLKKVLKGLHTQDILKQILPKIISNLSFPKMMRWSDSPLRFSRPIKNILCLFNQRTLPFTVGGINSSHFSSGHRIHFPRKIKVRSFSEYKKVLKKNKVIIDQSARKKMILQQIEKKLSPLNAILFSDEKLLDKVVFDVEHPHVFLGSFPEEYLKLPLEILSTAMREGQNLFSVVQGKKQLPYFIGVADAYRDNKDLIRKGNERVLKARLEDARFFWNQDSKSSLSDKSKSLDRIIFQEKLGNYDEKTKRLEKIVSYIADKLEAKKEKKSLLQAASLCKADLLTEMVREFSDLQGRVGGLYAKEEGKPVPVWKAIYEHYQPLSIEDPSPSQLTGAILSIADKLDSTIGVLGIGIEVTGSRDPYGLRRNAQGLCKIILEKKFDLSFSRLLDKVLVVYGDRFLKTKNEIKENSLQFFKNRMQHIFEKQGYRYDLIHAALGSGIDNLLFSHLRLRALDQLKDSPQFEPMILIAKRVNNILRDHPRYKVNEEFFSEKEERDLFTSFSIIEDNALPLIAKGDFSRAQKIVFRIRSVINNFFDNVLVMVEDKRVRRNRLALLQAISALLIQIADYSQIVVAGSDKS
jgi:glycyl-tRNA synthetase beta chain